MHNYLKRLKLTDYLLLLLTFIISVISITIIFYPRGILYDLVDNSADVMINGDSDPINIKFSAQMDSVLLESLIYRLADTGQNAQVKQLIKEIGISEPTHGIHYAKVLIISG